MKWRYKIKISWLWVLFLPFLSLVSFSRVYFDVLLMLIFHELMHVFSASLLGIKVEQIMIYPFGMCAKFHGFGLGKPLQEGIVASMGICSHFFIGGILFLLFQINWISNPYYQYLSDVNIGLALFNFIPIYPLDGFRMLQSLLHQWIPYRKAYLLSLLLSWLFLFLNTEIWCSSISAFMISMLSMFATLRLWYHRHHHYLTFYWYRYLHQIKAKPKYHMHQDLYRGYENYIIRNEMVVHETKWLYEKLGKW